MDLKAFEASLDGDAPPEGISPSLRALWQQAKGDWHEAHRLAQAQDDAAGAWVHAHLHRVEGDDSNAGYWYRRAGRPVSTVALKNEWTAIAAALLSGQYGEDG